MSPQATAFGTQGRSWGVWSPERRRPEEAVGLPSMSRCGWRIELGLGFGFGLGTGGYSYLPGWRAVEYAPGRTLHRPSAHAARCRHAHRQAIRRGSSLVAGRGQIAEADQMQDALCSIQHSAFSQLTAGRATANEGGDVGPAARCVDTGNARGYVTLHILVLVSESSTSVRGVRCACGVLCGSLLRSRSRSRSRSASGAAVRKLEGRRADNSDVNGVLSETPRCQRLQCVVCPGSDPGRWSMGGPWPASRAFGRLLLYGAAREYGP